MGFLKSLFGGTASKSTSQTNKSRSFGHGLSDRYSPFITGKESAKIVALTVLWHGKTRFIYGPDGEIIRASDSGIPLPHRLQSFVDKYYDEERMTVDNQVAGFTEQLTRTIENQTVQTETIYSIAEAIVEKYNL